MMKKLLIFFILFALIFVCVACGNQLTYPDNYEVQLYERSAGGTVSNEQTPRYDGEKLGNVVAVEKENMTSKTDVFFGREAKVHYYRTEGREGCSDTLDCYEKINSEGSLFVKWSVETGKIMYYSARPVNNRKYVSPVNPNSTEKEYLAYAKKILKECAGISLDGWEVRITTYRDEYGIYNGFLNYSHEIPEYNAQYTFVFYKTISGIERNDSVYITMTNVGEIVTFEAIQYNDAFEPFEDAVIDRKRVENALMSAFSRDIGGRATSSQIEELELVVKGDTLWAKGAIVYKTGAGPGKAGIIYVVKVAELIKEAVK